MQHPFGLACTCMYTATGMEVHRNMITRQIKPATRHAMVKNGHARYINSGGEYNGIETVTLATWQQRFAPSGENEK